MIGMIGRLLARLLFWRGDDPDRPAGRRATAGPRTVACRVASLPGDPHHVVLFVTLADGVEVFVRLTPFEAGGLAGRLNAAAKAAGRAWVAKVEPGN